MARSGLLGMYEALESLERGEAGAAGAFVIRAREYIRAYREHVRMNDRLVRNHTAATPAVPESSSVGPEETSENQAVLGRFNRLVEHYRQQSHNVD